MKIYILELSDTGNYAAYTSFEKAKQVLWECYCDDIPMETRGKYIEEDLRTLADGYIIDYGHIDGVTLVDE